MLLQPRSLSIWLVSLAVLGPSLAPVDAQSVRGGREKASMELLVDRTAYEAGETVRLAAQVTVDPTWHVQAHEPSLEYLIPTELALSLPDGSGEPSFDYPEPVLWQAGFETEPLAVYEETFPIFATFQLPPQLAEREVLLEADLRYQACDDKVCLPPTNALAALRLKIESDGEAIYRELFDGEATAAGGGAAGPVSTAARSPAAFALMLALAFVGGLILNAMPCVLPVLSLKVFSLVQAAGLGRRQVVSGALATSAGILFSFWVLALLAIVARGAGRFVGWGVQFQNPAFVSFLAVVMVLFALNMWGLFEIRLPQSLSRAAEGRPKEGLLGHFWWGLFATLMATPCSAPFLGSAVGFALSQQAATILVMFTAIGVGMASPYLLLAAAPAAASILPRPGAWMEMLRGLMGFLLAGTTIWLLFVLAAQIDPVRLAFVQLGLLGLGLCAWLHRHTGGLLLRRLAAGGLVTVAIATLWISAQGRAEGGADRRPTEATRLIRWTEWDREQAEALARDGELVFVDVTADWCATCKFNERLVLETEEVAGLFSRHGVVAMKADWTNRDDEIGAYLAEFGRYGIPFYALYRPGADPHVFSELLTKQAISEAIEEAVAMRVAAAP